MFSPQFLKPSVQISSVDALGKTTTRTFSEVFNHYYLVNGKSTAEATINWEELASRLDECARRIVALSTNTYRDTVVITKTSMTEVIAES